MFIRTRTHTITAPPLDLSHIALDAEDPTTSELEPRVAVCFIGQLKNVQPVHVAN